MLIGLARIVDDVEQIELFARGEPLAKRVLHQRTQTAGGILDHVDQLLEFAVNVADHVNRAFWQRERRTEIGNRGERRVGVGILDAQSPQIRESLLVRRKMIGEGRLVAHKTNYFSLKIGDFGISR